MSTYHTSDVGKSDVGKSDVGKSDVGKSHPMWKSDVGKWMSESAVRLTLLNSFPQAISGNIVLTPPAGFSTSPVYLGIK